MDQSQPVYDIDFGNTYRWGPILLGEDECPQHFLAIASTSGGKTTVLRLLMQDVIPEIKPGRDTRALIYDPKQEIPSIVRGIDPKVRMVLLNPFDERGAAWDMAKDIQEPRVAVEIAFTLIPQQHESQPFFSDAARHLMYGVMVSYMWRKLDWSFADLIRGLSSPKRLRNILAACPHTKSLIPRYFGDKRLLSNILSTIATKVLPFEPIAACWESASERVSLEDWVNQAFVLVLGNSETSRAPINALNRCIFKRATDLHLNQSESWTRRTWWFLDELSEAGKLDGLISLCKKSRSKGGCVVLAFQSIAGLRDPKLYGPHQTAEILGQMGHRFVGRLECPETAKWAADLIGDQEIRQLTESHGWSGTGPSRNVNEQFVTQKTILPSQFLSLPPCNDVDGLAAYYLSRITGAFAETIPGTELFGKSLDRKDKGTTDFIPRNVECQYLDPWSREDANRFAPPRKSLSRKPPRQTKKRRGLANLDELLDEGW